VSQTKYPGSCLIRRTRFPVCLSCWWQTGV